MNRVVAEGGRMLITVPFVFSLAGCAWGATASVADPRYPQARQSPDERPTAGSVMTPLYALRGRPVVVPMPKVSRSRISRAPNGGPLLFISNFAGGSGNTVGFYDADATNNPAPLGSITDGVAAPEGIAVDSKGTLYVTDASTNSLTEYPAGQTKPSVTLSTGLSNPANVAVSARLAVAVANIHPRNEGTVVEFKAGSTTPTRTITCTDFPVGLAYNDVGDLYIGDARNHPTGPTTRIWKLAPGSSTCVDTKITNIHFSGGMAFDRAENLWIIDQPAGTIYMYPKGSSTPGPFTLTGFVDPIALAFDGQAQNVFVADFGNNDVLEFPYMSTTKIATFSNQVAQPLGVAISPASPI